MEPNEVEDPDVLDEMLEDRDYLKASIEKLKADLAAIDNRLRLLGRGDHASRRGRVVSIRPPNRSFDVDRAAELAPDSVKIAAVSVSWDAAKLKAGLTSEQLQTCMTNGNGQDRVVVQ